MENKYTISQENLNKILSEQARALVGICMRRFEIFDNDEKYESKNPKEILYRKQIKKELKEILYEHHRTLKSILIAFSSGVNFIETIRNPKA